MKTRYPISAAIDYVAQSLARGSDCTPTTARCALNDCLDDASRNGYAVNFDFNQDRAVRSILRRITDLRRTT